MNKSLVVDNAMMTVWVYPARGMIHHVMKSYCYGRDFREGLTKGTEAMRLHKVTKWLSDDRASGPLPKDDEKWAYEDWFPQTVAAGWKHWAILQPAKVIAKIKYARATSSWADLGINARVFTDPDEAMKWLDAQ
jgi:hypothetical protein